MREIVRELSDLFRRDESREEIENVKYRLTFDFIIGAAVIVFSWNFAYLHLVNCVVFRYHAMIRLVFERICVDNSLL